MKFDCVRSNWLIHAWSFGCILEPGFSKQVYVYFFFDELIYYHFVFIFTDLAFSVASFIVDAVTFPILFVTNIQ